MATMVEVFCDWLDVTYQAGDTALDRVRSFASEFCDKVEWSRPDSSQYAFHHGSEPGALRVERPRHSKGVERVSASGAALARIRALGVVGEYLGLLGEAPHNVTRLDASLDVAAADPGKVVRAHYRKTRDGVAFGRKALATSVIFAPGLDGRDTGTVYHGYGSDAKVKAKVYDKAFQMMARHALIVPPAVRYELTFRREVGASLRDAYDPSALFWHHASPLGLKRPPAVPDWSPGAVGCVFPRREPPTAYARLLGAIDRLPLADLSRLCDEVGGEGVAVAGRHLVKRLTELRDSSDGPAH